ncbi:putative Swr1p complex component (Swc5) [Aspergillus mulundensis]|uniref:SWR1-complex protein 5 n=1 Tax=Aspergillus mulundensis TaxID=1810919 RepID=A0A3D8SVE5_9EURO|nr:SWR1-complex protein 5 [Aspergillus mulundensis]RDW90244.1 SWR1-complex protein 5 [Aspergillus mulundensis]
MADADVELDDEQYDSADDEDFTLDQAGDDDDAELSSSDEETSAEPAAKKRKTTGKIGDAAHDDAELDSGDEAMIRKAKDKKQKQKRGKKGSDNEDDVDFDDEGGPGGFVKTRAMRMHMQEERKPLAKIDGATIDVDALWAQMNAPDSHLAATPTPETKTQEATPAADVEMRDQENATGKAPAPEKRSQPQYPEEMVKIKRTYKFAGEMITEEKIVPRDSAEAKLFLSGNGDGEVVTATEDDIAGGTGTATTTQIVRLRRPLRKISRFDPNPSGAIKKSWEKQPLTEAGPGQEENARGPKINTVEKSRMDWAAYVDRAGISDELRVHSKAKEGFLGRMDFLDRVDAKKEEERRNVRLKGM